MKFAHISPIKSTYLVEDYARIYIDEIVSLRGVPLSSISDRGSQFTSHFWRYFQKWLGTRVKRSTTFYPKTNGQAERTIPTLDDM